MVVFDIKEDKITSFYMYLYLYVEVDWFSTFFHIIIWSLLTSGMTRDHPRFLLRLDVLLDFIVESQDKSATGSTENVGEGSLEEGASTFGLGDLDPAVEGVLVDDVFATRLHHHTTTDSVEWV